MIKQDINTKAKEKPNSKRAYLAYLLPIKYVEATYQIKHHWYIIPGTVYRYNSVRGGYIYRPNS